ncbi:membrane dipeptidase [Pedobacter sp. SYSU D00535]|uniref:membrane dipeptidase n=1 Tax=Pedobacter sp. SYSU D00535 TaxID=2810308 RepID=UPI001A9713D4|nr:membrane dipeptidase [Pedobacter sp. SYSU D00535]
MLNLDFSIDLHCHPTYKPMGHSYKREKLKQSKDPAERSSMWFYNPPSVGDKVLNQLLSVTKFSQANLTACYYGSVWVISASLGSIEKWFFRNKLEEGNFSVVLDNFAAGLSIEGIRAIEETEDYFQDLLNEMSFIRQMNNVTVEIDGNPCRYRVVSNFGELQALMKENLFAIEDAGNNGGKTEQPITIAILPSIEGLHVLNTGLKIECEPELVLKNLKALKQSEMRPWFVTFSHHFYNELCGQARSLSGMVAGICNQEEGLGQSFTALGKQVLNILLSEDDGKPIFIDIKHLSPPARQDYFRIRAQLDPENKKIPIIISHGACTGLPNYQQSNSSFPELGNDFCQDEINFYDDEIVELVKSDGIFGLQLDERRVASKEAIRKTKRSIFRNKIMHYRSELLWKQIQYVAELLDANGLPAWKHLAIGSDYDGIVDPINSFWTVEQYDYLKSHLERHAFNYLQHHGDRLKQTENRNITAHQIVTNIFQTNAWQFFERWY